MSRKPRRPVKPATKSASRKRPSDKAAQDDSLDDAIAAGAKALGLKIDKRWQASVRWNLQIILRHGAIVTEFKLPDEAEPAPVFKS